MRTTELFKFNRSSKRINESFEKTFGKKLKLETFSIEQLEDARNKLRTQIHTVRSESNFNETVENDTLTQAQFMHDAIVAELAERNEPIVDNTEIEEEKFDPLKHVKDPTPGEKKAAKDVKRGSYADRAAMLKSAEADGRLKKESAPPTAKGERMVKHIKQGYADDGKLTDKEKGIAYATAWKQHNKEKNESVETGDDMTRLQEGEIQQASAIVTAKTMVDRVGRWIEELSGMENDTLLQLGDSIRDEMGQEQAKGFIEAVAPAIQQALENLKTTREALASGVRTLTGEEQSAGMLGAEPPAGGDEMGMGDEMGGEAEPDAMNAEPADDFAAAEPAAGGAEEAGRAQRESIDRGNSLLKVLAG
jgi:hypothetical protein